MDSPTGYLKGFRLDRTVFFNQSPRTNSHTPNIISTIMLIAENRQTQANTEYDLVESSFLQRGINQGNSISPILWYIYYDVLLTRISNTMNGFKIIQPFIHDLCNLNQSSFITVSLPAMAYMDDTI